MRDIKEKKMGKIGKVGKVEKVTRIKRGSSPADVFLIVLSALLCALLGIGLVLASKGIF